MPTNNGQFTSSQVDYSLLSELELLNPLTSTGPQLMDKYPLYSKQGYFAPLISAGQATWTPNKKFYHNETVGKTMPGWTAADSPAQPGAGANVTVTIAGPYYESDTLSNVVEGHFYQNLRTGEVFRIGTVNDSVAGAFTAVLRPAVSTVNPDVNAGDFFAFFARYVGESSDTADGLYQRTERIEQECFMVRTDYKYTDQAQLNVTDILIDGKPSQYKQIQNPYETERFMSSLEVTCMLGPSWNNLSATIGNSTAEGLVNQITQTINQNAVNDDFWKAIKDQVDAEGWTNDYDFLYDTQLELKISDYLAEKYKNGAILYVDPSSSGKEIDLARNFRSYNIYGIQVNFKNYAFFNAQKIYGAPAGVGQYRNFAVAIPQGFDYDAVTGRRMKRMDVRYQAQKQGDPMIDIVMTGGFGLPVKTSQKKELVVSHESYIGLETFGLNGYFKVSV